MLLVRASAIALARSSSSGDQVPRVYIADPRYLHQVSCKRIMPYDNLHCGERPTEHVGISARGMLHSPSKLISCSLTLTSVSLTQLINFQDL